MSFIVKHDARAHALPLPAPVPASVGAVGETLTIDFRSLLRSIWRRKLWMLVPMVLTTLAGLAFALMSEPKYASVVQILVDPREIQVIRSDTPLRQNMPETGQTMAENAIVILRSRSVLMTMVEKEKLHEDAEFIGKGALKEGTVDTLEGRKLRALRTLERRIGTKRADRSSVIEASIWTGNAEEQVEHRIEALAKELSFIEALRERAQNLNKIRDGLEVAHRMFKNERNLKEEIVRMQTLSLPPITDMEQRFAQVDAQTGEILTMLSKFERNISYVREMRDDLHQTLMPWDEILEDWEGTVIEKGGPFEAVLKKTYQFLARNYSQAKHWRLAARPAPR